MENMAPFFWAWECNKQSFVPGYLNTMLQMRAMNKYINRNLKYNKERIDNMSKVSEMSTYA